MHVQYAQADGWERYLPQLTKLWSVWWWRDFGCAPRPRCRSFRPERSHLDRVGHDTRRDPMWNSWVQVGARFRSGKVAANCLKKKEKEKENKSWINKRFIQFNLLFKFVDWRRIYPSENRVLSLSLLLSLLHLLVASASSSSISQRPRKRANCRSIPTALRR